MAESMYIYICTYVDMYICTYIYMYMYICIYIYKFNNVYSNNDIQNRHNYYAVYIYYN